jgi:hypothetical protein
MIPASCIITTEWSSVSCIAIFLFVLPAKIPNVNYFTRFLQKLLQLITAMIVDTFVLPLTFGSFVVTGMFRVVVRMVRVMEGKHSQIEGKN